MTVVSCASPPSSSILELILSKFEGFDINGAFSDAWIMAPYVEEPNLILMGTGADAANGDSITQTPDEVGLVAPPMLNYYYKYAWWYGTEENSEEGGLKLTLQDQTNPPLVAPIKIKNMEQTNILVNVVPIVSVVPENVAYGVSEVAPGNGASGLLMN